MAKNIASMIAFAIASIVIGSYQAVTSIRGLVPLIAIFLLIVFSVILVVAAFVLPEGELTKTDTYAKFKKYMGIPATILFVLVVLNYFGLLGGVSESRFWDRYGDYIAAILMLVIFGVVAYLLVREPGAQSQSQQQNNK